MNRKLSPEIENARLNFGPEAEAEDFSPCSKTYPKQQMIDWSAYENGPLLYQRMLVTGARNVEVEVTPSGKSLYIEINRDLYVVFHKIKNITVRDLRPKRKRYKKEKGS